MAAPEQLWISRLSTWLRRGSYETPEVLYSRACAPQVLAKVPSSPESIHRRTHNARNPLRTFSDSVPMLNVRWAVHTRSMAGGHRALPHSAHYSLRSLRAGERPAQAVISIAWFGRLSTLKLDRKAVLVCPLIR